MSARSQTVFEKLVMPGELTKSHAKLEKECTNCHTPFAKQAQTALCLACHKDTAVDINERRRFHGKRTEARSQECRQCHTDHKGRGADIVQFDRQTFNHASTDFELTGGHQRVTCEGCHPPAKKFRTAPSVCAGCHKKLDPHRGVLGDNCASCHVVESWRTQRAFDHTKTKFPLLGAHTKVTCAVCHVGERYRDLPHACVDCHRINDPHTGRYGSKCESCHVQTQWKLVRFDHAKATRFPLRGEHANLKCDSCHTGNLYGDKLRTTCVSCHKAKDPHGGQLGPRCETCHTENSWRKKVSFDHELTMFPLIGLHAAVPCDGCHRSQTYKEASKACATCHPDDHHQGRLGRNCSQCHTPNGWQTWRFDHTKQTKFPLTGKHSGLDCAACHAAKAETKMAPPTECYGCHSHDDTHRGSFGRACERCHSATSFREVRLRN